MIGATLLEVQAKDPAGKSAALGGALLVNSSEHAELLNAEAVTATMHMHWP
jgi:hypothetical protein